MTHITAESRIFLTAGLAAATIATAALTVPANAGGSISFNFAPSNAEEEQALRTGLFIYTLVKGAQNGSISQYGHNNQAGLAQHGYGNVGVVHQEGDGHSGTVQQHGNHNAYGLFQFGKNTSGHATQSGYGQTGATFQFGW